YFLSGPASGHRRPMSPLEKLIGGGTRRVLLFHVRFEPVDFVVEQLHALTKLFHGKQCEVLSYLVRDLLFRFVILVDRRHFELPRSCHSGAKPTASAGMAAGNLTTPAAVVTSPRPA